MEDSIFGIVLLVERPFIPSSLDLYGKPLYGWAEAALGSSKHVCLPFDANASLDELPAYLKTKTDPDSEFTVVVFSDTPLISKNTISDALTEISAKNSNVVRLTRGFVFRTEYLLGCDRLFAPPHFYADEEDFLCVSSLSQFALVADVLRQRIIKYHMNNGVLIYDVGTTYIDAGVSIETGVVIHPNNTLKGKTVIEKNAVLQSGNNICDSFVGEGAKLVSSTLVSAYVGKNTTVGPYAYLRAGARIGSNCRIGDFVEIKKSIVGSGSKVSHLAYVGDCEMGSNCNIGCGVVVANYDGKEKHRTILGDKVFVGSNSNLIAPIVLENGCFVAAGSTLTDDVPEYALAIARSRQTNKLNWKKSTEE